MMILAVETTAAVASAALLKDGALVAEREADAGKKHAETLLPLLHQHAQLPARPAVQNWQACRCCWSRTTRST